MALLTTSLTPRFYETDALGHIGNTAITGWFEVARSRMLDVIWKGEARPANVVVASMTIDYLRETFYGSEVYLDITAVTAGNTSLTVECEMRQNDQVTVKASAVLVQIDLASKTKVRVPDSVRAAIAALSAD